MKDEDGMLHARGFFGYLPCCLNTRLNSHLFIENALWNILSGQVYTIWRAYYCIWKAFDVETLDIEIPQIAANSECCCSLIWMHTQWIWFRFDSDPIQMCLDGVFPQKQHCAVSRPSLTPQSPHEIRPDGSACSNSPNCSILLCTCSGVCLKLFDRDRKCSWENLKP